MIRAAAWWALWLAALALVGAVAVVGIRALDDRYQSARFEVVAGRCPLDRVSRWNLEVSDRCWCPMLATTCN